MPVRQCLTPTSYSVARNTIVQFLSHGRDGLGADVRPIQVELEHIAKSGRAVWCEVTIRVSWEQDGNRLHLEGVTRDITQRKSFERNLASLIDQRQQQMVQQLHDELGQNLLGVRLMAEGLKKSLLARDAVEVPHARELAQAAERAQHCVGQIIKGVRLWKWRLPD